MLACRAILIIQTTVVEVVEVGVEVEQDLLGQRGNAVLTDLLQIQVQLDQ